MMKMELVYGYIIVDLLLIYLLLIKQHTYQTLRIRLPPDDE